MSAYLKSWIYGQSATATTPAPQVQADAKLETTGGAAEDESEVEVAVTIEVPNHEEDVDQGADAAASIAAIKLNDGDDEGKEDDADSDVTETDVPPAFPALNSAQRMSSSAAPTTSAKQKPASSAIPSVLLDARLMPPPPLPSSALRVPGVPPSRISGNASAASTSRSSSSLMPPPGASSGAMLGVPPSTSKAPVKKFRDKVALAPGYGPLDWAALKSSGADLRGVDTLTRVTPSMLKEHRGRNGEDAWTTINGKVYNITAYLPYHPGGEKELMRVAGRDGTKLFGLTHAWVNAEFMLDACLVGFLVSESYGS